MILSGIVILILFDALSAASVVVVVDTSLLSSTLSVSVVFNAVFVVSGKFVVDVFDKVVVDVSDIVVVDVSRSVVVVSFELTISCIHE